MEQGMSSALQVEKTSKRGGRIVHEKDIMPPPPPLDNADRKDPPITEIVKNPSKVNQKPCLTILEFKWNSWNLGGVAEEHGRSRRGR